MLNLMETLSKLRVVTMFGSSVLKPVLHTNLLCSFIASRIPIPGSGGSLPSDCHKNKREEKNDILFITFHKKGCLIIWNFFPNYIIVIFLFWRAPPPPSGPGPPRSRGF
jgi:hypothetical protein